MAQWLIIAALATIGVTLLLIGVFYRLNRSTLERHQAEVRRRHGDGGDSGGVYVPASGSSRHNDDAGTGDSAGDGGGSD